MRRLQLIGSWKRLGIQAGLLGGLGLAFVGGTERPAEAGGQCPSEGMCSFKKPNFMIVLDYSSSMNTDFGNGQTRWEAAVEAIGTIFTANNGFFNDNMHTALIRFGHDPSPNPGSMIVGDTSGLVDGVSLDVHWYDPADAPDFPYFGCNGAAITGFLAQVDAPLCNGNPCSGIGTWTYGGLTLAQDTIIQTRADHPTDLDPGDERFYANLLMTDGLWTDPIGFGMNAMWDPAIVAGDLFMNDNVSTYVVAFGGAMGQAEVDQIAMAGGTGAAIDAGMGQLIPALQQVLDDIAAQVIIPECTSGLPRIMILLDASSSMLNVGNQAGAMGTTGWDQAHAALSAGANSLFDVPVNMGAQVLEDVVHLGLTVFGHNNPDESELLVQYGPCMQDNFSWALDPVTSCAMPGCDDPWGGPPITWTFVGPGDPGYPGFDADTYSHMPQCNNGNPPLCNGSGTYTHLGLQLIAANQQAYAANPPPLYPADASTQYINILITDGNYNSTNAQVSAPLIQMYMDGITTYVIGMGDGVGVAQLNNLACWGSGGAGAMNCAGGTEMAYDANNQAQLEQALADIVEGLNFDPCCAFNDCSFTPEPSTNEPDPVPPPPMTSSSDGGMVTGSSDSGPVTGSSDSAGTTAATTDGTGSDGTTSGTSATGGSSSDAGTTADGTGTAGTTAGSDDTSASDSGTGGAVDESGGSSDSLSGSGSSVSNSGTASTTATSTTASGGDTETDSETVGEVPIDDDCGCQTDNAPRSLLASLLTFGFVGAFRRRRKS